MTTCQLYCYILASLLYMYAQLASQFRSDLTRTCHGRHRNTTSILNLVNHKNIDGVKIYINTTLQTCRLYNVNYKAAQIQLKNTQYKFQPIMLNFYLLSNAQKLPIMLNIMPTTAYIAIMPQFVHDFIIFNDYISQVPDKFLPVILGCSALIFDLLCSVLYSKENLFIILYQISMITIS